MTNKTNRDPVPTIMAPAINLLHPMLFNPNTKEPIDPPADHKYALGISISIGRPDQPLQVSPQPIWLSGTNPEEMGQKIKDLIIEACEGLDDSQAIVRPPTPEEFQALGSMREGPHVVR